MKQSAETVIWDLDGTILDSMGVLVDGLGEVAPTYGLEPPTREAMAKYYHGTLEDAINGAMGDLSPVLLKSIVKDFLAVQDNYYDLIEDHLYPDALELMGRLHEEGMKQLVVTNREHEGRLRASPRHIVKHSSLDNYIDAVVCGDDSEHRKPKPEVLDPVRRAGSISLARLMVIGDQFVDAKLAHNLDAPAVLVARHGDIHHLDQLDDGWEEKTLVVSSLAEVKL